MVVPASDIIRAVGGDGCVLSHDPTLSPIMVFVLNERDKRPVRRTLSLREGVGAGPEHPAAAHLGEELRLRASSGSGDPRRSRRALLDRGLGPRGRPVLHRADPAVPQREPLGDQHRGGRHRADPALLLPASPRRGYAVGARFRPGCFRPLLGGPVSELTDRHRPIAEVLGRDTTELAQRVAGVRRPGRRVALLADFLAADWPEPDPTGAARGRSGRDDRRRPRDHPGRPGGGAGGTDRPQPAAALRRVRRRRAQVGHPALPAAGRGGPGGRPGRPGLGGRWRPSWASPTRPT